MKRKHVQSALIVLKLLAVLLPALLVCIRLQSLRVTPVPTGAVKTVVDMSKRKVIVPAEIHRVAALEVLGYEKVFLLGQSDKLAIMNATNPPWMERTNPKVRQIPKFFNEPDAEALMNMNVDLVLYRYDPEKTQEKLDSIGIPGVVSQPSGQIIGNAQTFQEVTKRNMRLYGDLMGGEAKKRAEEWCSYFDEKVRYVTSRVGAIPEEERPRIYYLRGPSALTTQGNNTNTLWYGQMAGGSMITKVHSLVGKGPVSMEDLLLWDPEYIFVGRLYSPNLVLKDKRWLDVRAVKEGKVYQDPEGVFFWDGSSEGVLLMEFMAKKIHPELFQNLDMKMEIQDYYARFYNYKLTDTEADKILLAQTP
jgi:iron complex transport system substrate-binding protein